MAAVCSASPRTSGASLPLRGLPVPTPGRLLSRMGPCGSPPPGRRRTLHVDETPPSAVCPEVPRSMKLTDGRLRISATDLSDFLACRHLTRRSVAGRQGPTGEAASKRRGLQRAGRAWQSVTRPVCSSVSAPRGGETLSSSIPSTTDSRVAEVATREAIERGADLIYQGVLTVGDEVGLPDFLIRADLLDRSAAGTRSLTPSSPAARRPARSCRRPSTRGCSRVSRAPSPRACTSRSAGETTSRSFRVADFAAYERQVSQMLGEFALGDEDPYPEPGSTA